MANKGKSGFEIVTAHTFAYSNRERIPLRDIANSLLALERIVQSAKPTIERSIPSAKISELKVDLRKIESGSLVDDILVRIVFRDQAGLDSFCQHVRAMMGIDVMQGQFPFLGTVITLSVLLGGLFAIHRLTKKKPGDLLTIKGNYNTVIQLAADQLKKTPEAIQNILDESVKNRAILASNSVKLIRPAKSDKSATITVDEDKRLELGEDFIREVPESYEKALPEVSVETFDNIEVNLRAIDYDNHEKGWAVIVPTFAQRRVPLHVETSINLLDLAAKPDRHAKMELTFRYDKEANKILRSARLLGIND